MTRKAGKVSRRPQLTAEVIAKAALTLADKEGLDNLSFRNLARKLGCEAMSIYHYFPSKAHLMDEMAAICLRELTFPPEDWIWQKRLVAMAHEWRDMALRHSGFFPFLAVYRLNSEEGLDFLNKVILIFQSTGLSAEAQARTFRYFGYYLAGACLDEAIGYAKGPSSATPVPQDVAAERFPAIIGIGKWFSSEHHRATFEAGLTVIMSGIEATLAAETAKAAPSS